MMSRLKTDVSDQFYNLREGLETLCKRDSTAADHLARYLELEDFGGSNRKSLLRDLSDLLWQREFTENVALCFPNILLELLIRAEQRNKGEVFHRYMCIALGKLVRVHPDAVRFALQYFEKHPSPFAIGRDVKTPPKKRKFNDDHQKDDLDIVVACYNFLMISCEHFREIWDWSQFMELYFGHSNELISWIACHCLAWVTGMNDYVRQHVLEQFMIPEAIRSCSLEFDNLQAAVLFKLVGEPPPSNAYDVQRMYKSPYFVTVAGIQLKTCGSPGELSIVPVSSTMSNLHSLALGVASNKAVCLQGPVGSGKTALVEQLAHMTGRALPEEQQPPHFIKVQLGDEIDSKMLLGTYRCTDIPGEFVWQPGVLTQAAINGYWILLEDFDTAVMDVASVVASLLETGTLSVPGYKDTVKVAPGFQLFVTQRTLSSVTGFHKPISNSSSLLEKHWFQINVEPLSKLELIEVVQQMFPVLDTVASRMVKVFLLFSSGSHQSALNATEDTSIDDLGGLSVENQTHVTEASGRLISTRDLIKWCQRAIEGFDVRKADSALKVLQDGIDIFCCSVANAGSRLKLAISIASCLGVIKTKAEFFCQTYKPSINAMPNKFIAGRAFVAKQEASLWSFATRSKSSFAFTRPAACLLERVLCCVSYKEPVLLVGETGTGKTSVVQFLAERTNNHLLVINMNQQSDSSDLLGGYKPVDLKFIVSPVREEFEELFKNYFSVESNVKFLENIAKCFIKRKWSLLVRLMKQSYQAAIARLENNTSEELRHKKWIALGERLQKLESQINAQSALAFKFVEGSLVKALQKGYWVLLDEINLASAETLQCLSGLLEGSSASLYLLERGDREPVKRHSNFHLFACMNPATDVGKKDLPAGLRNRFTEFFVDELTEIPDLSLLVGTYLNQLSVPQDTIEKIVKFYLNVREEASKSLNDGTGGKPHYSLRTLCRALRVAAANPCGTVLRSLYEGLCLSFLTQLDHASHLKVTDMISKTVLSKGKTSILKQPLVKPVHDDNEQYVNFEGYWVLQGSLEPKVPEKYILTPSVRRNLHDLVRVVAIGHHPVLLQGETSVGKTSLITYLAKASGNHCVRINNHEHTDIQEYVGSYSADENGCLVFREGILVEAMRKGHWIILDELNLAPTDVLEALNRVLDDNRELYIPETQETVKADPRFMLFATQNPSGLYGGRKTLSRAFRNRFVELHFAEIPPKELETILEKRCQMPASYCKKLVAVMTELQLHRKGSAAFAGKQGFMTLRDLFRWGERYTLAKYQPPTKYYDWDQHLADEGYLVLAGRVRKSEEAEVISTALEKHIKRNVNPQSLFTLNDNTSPVTRDILEKVVSSSVLGFEHIVWTYNMRRLAVLVGKSCQFREPVLLVGETGCGKTTVSQLLSSLNKQKLFSVNCHMHTECADFLGGLRPVRDHNEEKQKLFEWVDGPLINAMQEGGLFLADEISLADDSVLERMNSLLEPERTLLLAEKGTDGSQDNSLIVVAKDNFLFIGTMNPGGDYGKKELSPALRNRFTEIWCQSCKDRNDLLAIIEHNLRPGLTLGNAGSDTTGVGSCMMDFIEWFTTADIGKRFSVSVRDILAWVNFINVVTENKISALNIQKAYVHGACLTFLDSFGSGVTSAESLSNLRVYQESCLKFLCEQVKLSKNELISGELKTTEKYFGISPFFIEIGKHKPSVNDFTFHAPTTGLNALHVLRAMQLLKPILLEGSPGVGKTTLITALAKASGNNVIRINLSEQTDISDLFGADLPVEGGQGGQFAWRDGPLLRALKAGDWILLDELNLASQSVLEGLNACLDHRGEVFIPELDRSFQVKAGRTHLFGAQNPLRQGGARRGLPQSFLNRFTQVYIDALSDQDLEFIICSLYPMVPSLLVKKLVQFNGRLHRETTELRLWGLRGGPWELNLRDLTRWCQAMTRHCARKESDMDIDFEDTSEANCNLNPGQFVDLIYVDRMRTFEDKEKVKEIYREEFGSEYPLSCDIPNVHVTQEAVYLGDEILPRIYPDVLSAPCPVSPEKSLLLLRQQYPALRSLARCVNMNWMSIIVGPSGSGKTCLVHLLAQLAGRELRVMAVNSAMDTTEILGGFEQADLGRRLEAVGGRCERMVLARVRHALCQRSERDAARLLKRLAAYRKLAARQWRTLAEEAQRLRERAAELREMLEDVAASDAELRADADAALADLRQVEARVADDAGAAGPTAGGTFEWVDSLLVKCLRDGSWLLLDGANLCSPAVLDRLNALLEPGGVLTVGERGVGADGELVTVAPHPAFRLFLALDPRHGDISRAMRNRGVELYLPEQPLGALDMAALLAARGLRRHRERRALLAAHQAAADAWPDSEPPGLPHLLHAAFLVGQRAARGQSVQAALLASCCDVYVKAHTRALSGSSAGAASAKQTLLQVVTAALEQNAPAGAAGPSAGAGAEEAVRPEDRLAVYDATPSTARLHEDSTAATVRQQGALLALVLGVLAASHTDSPAEFLAGLLDVHHEDSSPQLSATVLEFLPHLLYIFYEGATPRDLALRHAWLKQLQQQRRAEASERHVDLGECLNFAVKASRALSDTLTKAVVASGGLVPAPAAALEGLPWDVRWLPGGARLLRPAARDAAARAANRVALLARFLFLARVEEASSKGERPRPPPRAANARKPITVAEYSQAVSKGEMQDNVTSHPLVVHFKPILDHLDAFTETVLSSKYVTVSTEEWATLEAAFQWRFRLAEQGTLQLIGDPGSRQLDLVVARLTVHTHWLLKQMLSPLQALAKQDPQLQTSKCSKKLALILDSISSVMKSCQTPLHQIGKKLRRLAGQPLPYSSSEQSKLAQRIQRVTDLLLIWPSSDPGHMKLQTVRVAFLTTEAGKEARKYLVCAMENIRKSDQLEMVTECVERVERLCDEARLTYQDSSGTDLKPKIQEDVNLISTEVQLWPIQEYIALCLGISFMKEHLNVKLRTQDESLSPKVTAGRSKIEYVGNPNISMTLCAFVEDLPSIPAEMLSIVRQLSNPSDCTNIPLCELIRVSLLHHTLSPSRSLTSSWLSWNSTVDTSENETTEELVTAFEVSQGSLPMHCPLLTNLVTSLVVTRESDRNAAGSNLIAHSPLGRQHSITLKFNTLLNLLWRNMATLSSPNFCYKLNDTHCAYSVYLKLKENLNCILLDMGEKNSMTFSSRMNIAEKFDNFVKLEGKSSPEVQNLSEALHKLVVLGEKLEKLLKKKESESDVEILIAAGEAWMLIGCIQIILLSKFGHFDPVEKRTLQYLYVMEELKDTSQLLYARELQAKLAGLSLSDQMPEDLHPFIVASHERLKLLSEYKNELHKNLAFRPSVQPYFCQLTKDASHYSSSLGSAEIILGLLKKLQNMCQQLQESIQHPALAQTRVHELSVATGNLLNEERMWRNSQRIFCSRLEKTYKLHFPDLVIPLLSAAQQLCHGTSLLASTIQKLLVRLKFKLVEDIVKLVQFPVAVPKQGVPLGTVSLCLDRVFCQQLQLLCEDENDQPLKQETYRLMKTGLQDIRNIISAEGNVDSTTWSLLVEILSRIAKLWMSENDERKRKEIEEQQMFVQKGTTQCETLSDEQLEALGLQEFFPTTLEEDFGDFTLNTDSAPALKPVVSSEYLVSSEDMTFVSRLHFELMKMFTHTEWVAPPPSCIVKPNFVSPLLQRFQTFHQLLLHAAPGLDSSVDWRLAPSLALLTSLALHASNGNNLPNISERPVLHEFSKSASVIPERPPDFYHDSNVEEARQCLPVVSAIEKRTRELKKEWPDHPTLNQILVVIDRVTSFPITSPISRFLTGLEFLLEKLQDWEENAHSKVSMASHMQHLTNQIISWRKLELQCWKDCLNTAAYRIATGASHWWFHIFSIVESFYKSGMANTLNTEKNFIKSLQKFMEKSVLGDFHARLDLLFSFHCHAIHLSNFNRQSNLVNILWNVHQYYNQFSEPIALKIHDLRAPIEKKLRDFVKIARWNDINYWAVKKAVEKTRRTLLKYVREFEAILKQPVTSVLTNPHPGGASLLSEAAGQLDRRQRRQSMKNRELPPDFYVTSSLLGQLINPCETTQRATPLLNRANTLFCKSRTLIKEALPEILYPQMIKATDEIIVEMINTVNHLKNLEIPSDSSNQRRKSLAKSHLQQKKKALTDGFRSLQQIGISFRKGVAAWNDEETANSLFDFNVPPLDLVVGVQHSTFQLCGLVKATSKGCRPDGELATVCDGSETYFYRSIARLSLLDTFLKSPHPDIGPALIERLRGFSSHLMIYAKMQKEKLIESFNLLRFLRCYMSQVASLKKSDTILPRQSELHQCWRNLNNLLVNIILWAEQFLILLKACPQETESSFIIDLSGQSSIGKISSMVQADQCWETLTKKVKSIIASASKFKLSLNKSWIVIPENPLDRDRKKKEMELPQGPKNLITPSHYELIIEGYGKVSDINEEIKTIKSMFENSEDCGNIFNPMTESIRTLEMLIQREVNIFKEMQTPDSSLKGSKRSDIEIENKELEICVNVPNNTKKVSDLMAMEVEEDRHSNQLGNVQISLSNKHLNEHDKKKAVNEFCLEAEHLLELTLMAIQKVYKKYTDKKDEKKSNEDKVQDQGDGDNTKDVSINKAEDFIGAIQDNHLKEKILENLFSDLSDLQIPQVNKMLSKLIHRLGGIMDLQDWEKEASECKRALVSCIPCIDQLSLLHQFFVIQQAASYRVTCKMMSVVLSISIDLAQKGFCIPPELMPQEGEEAGDPKGGLGLGEGEGEKDVSDRIQSEDQLEDARKPGEEKEDEQKDCKEEEEGIDSSQDFGGKIQDLEKDEEKDGSDDSEEEDEADKEMGEIGEEADKLDQEVWGSDSENEDEADEEEKEDQHGQGETTGNPELSAKDDKREGNESDEDNSDEGGDKKEKQKEINEFDEPEVAEDQVDPYHGKQPELPEPEPLDLPDDLQLDEEDGKEEGEDGENPFDIDAMKDRQIPEDQETQDEEPVGPEEETKEDPKQDSSDDDEEDEAGNEGQEKNDIQDAENNDEDEDKSGEDNEGKENNEKEEKSEEEEEEEKKKEEKALPSDDMPSESPAQAADMEAESCQESKDMVAENKNEQKDDGKQDSEELGEEGGDEQQGVGQAQAEEQKSGHRGHMSAPKDKLPSNTIPPEVEERKDKRQRPGDSDSTRTLGDVSEPNKKRLKTIDLKQENEGDDATKEGEEENNEEQGAEEGKKGEMYQHIKDSKESFDTQILDAATQDQAEKQPVPNKEEESAEEPSPEDDSALQDDDIMVDEDIKKQHPEQLQSGKKDKNKNNKTQSDEQEENAEMTVDVEGDVVLTEGPSRGAETTFHTQYHFEADEPPQTRDTDLQEIRQTLENQLSSWTQPPADAEAAQAWQEFVSLTAGLSRELSEQLRLVLEPTQAARLRGDYRTGRRINMRKVIPYIASQFRKDKIWLRRTKPSKREYQIVLAIDDSSSMNDNHTKELAFESLALVSQALSLLEAGELAVVSFGDKPQILHQLGDTFTEHSGGRLLQQFSFSQNHTKFAQLIDFCTILLQENRQRVSSGSECAQLLMIVSDGRGVFSEGDAKVRLAIRHARQNRIFMVFVVLDNPDSKHSILDIKATVFQGGKLLGLKSYLDTFPFPFYLILRDINCLPAVLSDALRQWFELVTNTDVQ